MGGYKMKVIMTGGGTGGHIYPAIAIADKIKRKHPDAEILFVGTEKGMEKDLYTFSPKGGYSCFSSVLEQKLMQQPKYWERYYHGNEGELAFARRFSLSDRCRYYLEEDSIKEAIARLIQNINAKPLPFGLTSQYFPAQKEAILAHVGPVNAQWLIKQRIRDVIKSYY